MRTRRLGSKKKDEGMITAKLKVQGMEADKLPAMSINTPAPDGYHTLSDSFKESSEISKGLLSGQYGTIQQGTETIEFRKMLDYDGNDLDFSNEDHRTIGTKILKDRLDSAQPKIKEAARLLADKKQKDVNTTMIRKWMGELGEVKILYDLLSDDVEAYLLTASAVKNDIIAITKSKDSREINMSLLSVKTTDLDTVPNKLGSNIMPDMKKWISGGTTDKVKIGDSEVDALSLSRATMEVKRQLYKVLSGLDGVHRNGTFVGDASNYKVGFESKTIDAPDGFQKRIFKNDTDWRRNRLVDEVSVTTMLSTPTVKNRMIKNIIEENNIKESEAELMINHLKDDLIDRIRKSEGNFTISNADEFMYEMFGKIIEETEATVVPSADTGILSISKTGEMETSILTKEDASKSRFDDVKKAKSITDARTRYIAIGRATGLDMRTRRLGGDKKDKGTGHLFPIDNPIPPKDAQTRGISINEYIAKNLK